MTSEKLVKEFQKRVVSHPGVFISAYKKINHIADPRGYRLMNWRFDSDVNYCARTVTNTDRIYCLLAISTVFSKN